MTIGRIAARDDLQDLYRTMVRPGDLKDTIRVATSLWHTLHDTGELRLAMEAPGRVVATLRGYVLAREMCRVIGGYVSEVVSAGGAQQVATRKSECAHDGAAQCSWRLTWSA